jgi:Abortive infection alpha
VPLQITAAFQDRVERMVARIANRVPEDRRVAPPAEVIGPALQHMKFLEEGNPLWQMFEELISRSFDKEGIQDVHPAFSNIIAQLARDEGVILYRLREESFEVVDVLDLNRTKNRFENRRIEQSNLPSDDLFLPDRLDLYYSHLESLNLVRWPVHKQDPIKDESGQQTGIRRFSRMHLTDFGRLFADACIPSAGFHQAEHQSSCDPSPA